MSIPRIQTSRKNGAACATLTVPGGKRGRGQGRGDKIYFVCMQPGEEAEVRRRVTEWARSHNEKIAGLGVPLAGWVELGDDDAVMPPSMEKQLAEKKKSEAVYDPSRDLFVSKELAKKPAPTTLVYDPKRGVFVSRWMRDQLQKGARIKAAGVRAAVHGVSPTESECVVELPNGKRVRAEVLPMGRAKAALSQVADPGRPRAISAGEVEIIAGNHIAAELVGRLAKKNARGVARAMCFTQIGIYPLPGRAANLYRALQDKLASSKAVYDSSKEKLAESDRHLFIRDLARANRFLAAKPSPVWYPSIARAKRHFSRITDWEKLLKGHVPSGFVNEVGSELAPVQSRLKAGRLIRAEKFVDDALHEEQMQNFAKAGMSAMDLYLNDGVFGSGIGAEIVEPSELKDYIREIQHDDVLLDVTKARPSLEAVRAVEMGKSPEEQALHLEQVGLSPAQAKMLKKGKAKTKSRLNLKRDGRKLKMVQALRRDLAKRYATHAAWKRGSSKPTIKEVASGSAWAAKLLMKHGLPTDMSGIATSGLPMVKLSLKNLTRSQLSGIGFDLYYMNPLSWFRSSEVNQLKIAQREAEERKEKIEDLANLTDETRRKWDEVKAIEQKLADDVNAIRQAKFEERKKVELKKKQVYSLRPVTPPTQTLAGDDLHNEDNDVYIVMGSWARPMSWFLQRRQAVLRDANRILPSRGLPLSRGVRITSSVNMVAARRSALLRKQAALRAAKAAKQTGIKDRALAARQAVLKSRLETAEKRKQLAAIEEAERKQIAALEEQALKAEAEAEAAEAYSEAETQADSESYEVPEERGYEEETESEYVEGQV